MSSVLILGGDSDFNLGDAAILESLCHSLQTADPDVQITTTSRRGRQRRLPGVVRILPRGPASVPLHLRCAAEQDLVIVGGGGLLQDDDSRAKMPYWASRLAALRLVNRNIVGHCLGAGPLRHAESRQLARLACATLRSVSVRDGFAQRWLSSCTAKPVQVVPDPAFMLPAADAERARAFIRSCGLSVDRPLLGVALRRWFHPLGGFIPHKIRQTWALRLGRERAAGAATMESFLDDVAAAVSALARELDADVILLPSYNVEHEGDAVVCRSLQGRLAATTTTALALVDDPALYKAVVGRLELMISARMHPLILAASMGVPVVGLAYNEKFAGALDLLGVPDQLMRLDEFADGSQSARLRQLAHDALSDRTDLAARAAELARQSHAATVDLLESTA
jgi:polysaccharide pyruvyl transferase WcaK-like protein